MDFKAIQMQATLMRVNKVIARKGGIPVWQLMNGNDNPTVACLKRQEAEQYWFDKPGRIRVYPGWVAPLIPGTGYIRVKSLKEAWPKGWLNAMHPGVWFRPGVHARKEAFLKKLPQRYYLGYE